VGGCRWVEQGVLLRQVLVEVDKEEGRCGGYSTQTGGWRGEGVGVMGA
jgi:hypothetical protein